MDDKLKDPAAVAAAVVPTVVDESKINENVPFEDLPSVSPNEIPPTEEEALVEASEKAFDDTTKSMGRLIEVTDRLVTGNPRLAEARTALTQALSWVAEADKVYDAVFVDSGEAPSPAKDSF